MKRMIKMGSALVALTMLFPACQEKADPFSVKEYTDLVINEVSAHDDRDDVDTWVEIVNNSQQDKDLSKLSLYLTDEYFDGRQIASFEGKTLKPGERLVVATTDEALNTGISSAADFSLVLALAPDNGIVDKFERADMGRLALPGS